MKQQHFYAFFISLVFMLLFMGACQKACKGVDCANGICNEADGTCNCNPGWLKDSNGKCTLTDECYNIDCGHGTCRPLDGACLCDAGWLKDSTGKCTKPNLCYNKDCGAHGTCNATTGSCDCAAGYEVNAAGKCDSISRYKFIGTYNVNDICPQGTFGYTSEILATTIINKITIRHYGGYESGTTQLEVVGYVSGNVINIPNQTVILGGQMLDIYETTGTLSGNHINLAYKIAINGALYSDCTSVYTKQ